MNDRRTCLSLLLSFALLQSGSPAAHAAGSPPVLTRQQIEADWLRQDEVRGAAGAAAVSAAGVTREEDAVGGVDGQKSGKWGFHTENEDNPWWQVDLEQAIAIDRVVLYNRCDTGMGSRNGRIMVLLSGDGKTFKQAYQHDSTPFLGQTDKKPLVVKLGGEKARYVRLQLPGKSYFHLDEVEIYRTGGDENIALHKPATQSSTSEWSARHTKTSLAGVAARSYPTALAIERGLKLADDLRKLGAKVETEEAALRRAAERLKQLPADAAQLHFRRIQALID